MSISKECIAMLLAGGQGSRLYALTTKMAKPAVPFGGKYRIIDFPLSNCINSGIDTVGVLTQYQPLELNEYIGNGQPWDLDRMNGGVHILPPYQKSKNSNWYTGTANAIYQNIDFIEGYCPEYILILSGDHIYKMDYSQMLDFHKEKGADCTIAVLEVPLEEASRFGIMNAERDGRIYEFEEKPKEPKSNLASMGIYIFNWKTLKKYLEQDEKDKSSDKDFGKNIIPKMLTAKQSMYAYRFAGYWKDVGTIDSLWEANMDLLNPHVPLELYDEEWKIYSKNPAFPPHYVSENAKIQHAMVTEGCEIYGEVDFSVIYAGVTIEEGAEVRDSIIMPNSVIKKGAHVHYAIVGENAVIGENCVVGCRPENMNGSELENWGVSVIGPGVVLSPRSSVLPKQILSAEETE